MCSPIVVARLVQLLNKTHWTPQMAMIINLKFIAGKGLNLVTRLKKELHGQRMLPSKESVESWHKFWLSSLCGTTSDTLFSLVSGTTGMCKEQCGTNPRVLAGASCWSNRDISFYAPNKRPLEVSVRPVTSHEYPYYQYWQAASNCPKFSLGPWLQHSAVNQYILLLDQGSVSCRYLSQTTQANSRPDRVNSFNAFWYILEFWRDKIPHLKRKS